jgi:hypothetical protein
MGAHTAVNGHRGEDGAIAAAPVIMPLELSRVWPPQPASDDGKWWRHITSAARVIFAHRGWLAAIPVVLVNAVAFAGQLAFLRDHLPWPLAGQVLVAVTLESVAVYLAWQAHLALAADDSALRLRLAAYGFAAVIGVMNYSHWMAPGWRPTFAAVTFGLMSVSSPWLWSVHSRRVSRDALKAKGLIEPHAVRLGGTRWAWHPWRSARVMFRATWLGENDPVRAIALLSVRPSLDVQDDGSEAPVAPSPVMPEVPSEPAQEAVSEPAGKPSPRKPRQPPKRPSGRDRAAAIIKKDDTLKNEEVAKRAGVSESTVERARRELAKGV